MKKTLEPLSPWGKKRRPTKAGGIRNRGQYDHIRVSGSDRSVNRLPRKPEVRSWKPEYIWNYINIFAICRLLEFV